MVESLKNLIYNFLLNIVASFGFGAHVVNYLYVIIISMIPVVELRLAIPVAYALGLPMVNAFLTCVIGNLIPVPFILLLITPLCNLLKKTKLLSWFPRWLEKKVDKNKEAITKYAKWGLFIFVAIPLPGTGAWTGALVASFLDFKFKDALISIIAGVLCAGVIVTLLTYGAFDFIINLF